MFEKNTVFGQILVVMLVEHVHSSYVELLTCGQWIVCICTYFISKLIKDQVVQICSVLSFGLICLSILDNSKETYFIYLENTHFNLSSYCFLSAINMVGVKIVVVCENTLLLDIVPVIMCSTCSGCLICSCVLI